MTTETMGNILINYLKNYIALFCLSLYHFHFGEYLIHICILIVGILLEVTPCMCLLSLASKLHLTIVSTQEVIWPPTTFGWFVLESYHTNRGYTLKPLYSAWLLHNWGLSSQNNIYKIFWHTLSSHINFIGNFQKVTHIKIFPSQAYLNMKFLS